MQFGTFSLFIALAASLLASYQFYLAGTKQQPQKKRKADKSNFRELKFKSGSTWNTAAFGLLTVVFVYLLWLILTHQYQYQYIYSYSSNSLSLGYLISALWAGQEGSFLLWAFLISILGFIYQRRNDDSQSLTMMVIGIVQAGFILLVMIANPFTLSGQFPADGAGLNPLLQNPWMVIHPPVLFLGYAAATIPFSITIAALIDEKFEHLDHTVYPWVLFSSATLGAGIIIGGFWAYEVLGWGGFWGWDPVENSSLIAWLIVMAYFHSLILSKKRNILKKTSISLSILAFFLVLYATFLTRSGVLSDFSVHSFQDLGINNYLIIYMGAALLGGFWLLKNKAGLIQSKAINFSGLNKEFILILTIFVLAFSAFLTLLGTSSPLITGLLATPAQVAVKFYNDVNLPIAIAMGALLTVAPYLNWENLDIKSLSPFVLLALSLGFISATAAYMLGLNELLPLLFLGFSASALVGNLVKLVLRIRKRMRNVAAPLTHIGVVIAFVGIVISGYFSETQNVIVSKENSGNALGYDIAYIADYLSPDGKNGIRIEINKDGKILEGTPRFYTSSYNQGQMREPFVDNGILKDLYVSPLQKSKNGPKEQNRTLNLIKGQIKKLDGINYRFNGFKMANHDDQKGLIVYANLTVSTLKDSMEIQPYIAQKEGQYKKNPAMIEGLGDRKTIPTRVLLNRIDADGGSIQLLVDIPQQPDDKKPTAIAGFSYLLEVSEKPFMGILWIGTIILSLGTFIAVKKKYQV